MFIVLDQSSPIFVGRMMIPCPTYISASRTICFPNWDFLISMISSMFDATFITRTTPVACFYLRNQLIALMASILVFINQHFSFNNYTSYVKKLIVKKKEKKKNWGGWRMCFNDEVDELMMTRGRTTVMSRTTALKICFCLI